MFASIEELAVRSRKNWEHDCLEMCPGVNLYTIPGASVFVASRVIDFPQGIHSHNEYEFTMPLHQNVAAKAGQKIVVMEKQKLTPFNSGQPHGVATDTKVDKIIVISCDKNFLEKQALMCFGQTDVIFENAGFDLSNNLRFLIGMFIEESISKKSGYQPMSTNIAGMILTEIIRLSKNNIESATPSDGSDDTSRDNANLDRAVDYLKEQYVTAFSIEEAARVAGLSPYYFIRAFKAHTGKTPYNFYIDFKIGKAKELLINRDVSITDVALSCGYSNSGHFSTVFKRKTGISPTEFKRAICYGGTSKDF
ncbi:MAG: AraC family transcriptional regulator [Bacillota bacterium]|nr:AraC family transcriptional regulator [Bacillota bacterium]